jgi:Uma2 family endonuclease
MGTGGRRAAVVRHRQLSADNGRRRMGEDMAPPDDRKTIEDVAREPEERYLELLDGVMVEKASPDIGHSMAQGAIIGLMHPSYGRKPGSGGGPGGWWILPELDISLGRYDWVRPDLAGYRRDKHASIPKTRPLPLAPDWVCEVVSESNASRDTVQKVRLYHRIGVGHYWLVDPARRTLTVLRHAPDGYQLVLSATVGERVRAEPFEAVELPVSDLFEDTG